MQAQRRATGGLDREYGTADADKRNGEWRRVFEG